MKNSKVLFIIDTLEIGGTEKSLLATVSKLKKVTPIICHVYKGETLKPQFELLGIPVHSLNISVSYGFRKAYTELSKIVEYENPCLLVGYLTRSEIITRLIGRRKNIPVIGTFVSDLYSSSYNKDMSKKSHIYVRLFKYINRFTAKYCSGFISNSEAIKRANAKHLKIPLDKIHVIHRGRDSKKIVYNPAKSISGKVAFLNVGRLVPVKGQENLILAFAELIKEYPNISLDIVGAGPLFNKLQGLIDSLSLVQHINLLGNRDDIHELFKCYDCFVFPSLSEGFSGAVVEAMFAGLPILASNISANKEAIEHLNTGYLFEADSVNSIYIAMKWYLDNSDTSISLVENAYNKALTKFELNIITARFENYLLSKIHSS